MEVMLVVRCLAIAVFCMSLTASSQVRIKVSMSQNQAQVGERVVITCSLTSTDYLNDILVTWIKQLEGKATEMGTNGFINADFENTGRYSITHHDNTTAVSFDLTIEDVQVEDSGKIGCKMPQHDLQDTENFVVFAPVQEIEIIPEEGVGEVIRNGKRYREDERETLYCTVKGSYPKPEVTMFIGQENITHLFEEEHKLVKEGTVAGLYKPSYVVTLHAKLAMDYSYSKQSLICKAHIPQSGFPDRTDAMYVDLRGYSPKFECNQTTKAVLDARDLQVTCRIMADPLPTHTNMHIWREDENHNENAFAPGTITSFVGEGQFEVDMILKIDHVTTKHAGRYIFEAKNSYGDGRHELMINRSAIHTSSGASLAALVPLTLMCLLMS